MCEAFTRRLVSGRVLNDGVTVGENLARMATVPSSVLPGLRVPSTFQPPRGMPQAAPSWLWAQESEAPAPRLGPGSGRATLATKGNMTFRNVTTARKDEAQAGTGELGGQTQCWDTALQKGWEGSGGKGGC